MEVIILLGCHLFPEVPMRYRQNNCQPIFTYTIIRHPRMLLLELKELKGPKELKDHKVLKVRLDRRVLEEQLVLREHKELKEPWVLLAI